MPILSPDSKTTETFAGLQIDRDSTVQKAGLFFGLYGPAGGGKTSMLARLIEVPEARPGLLVDAEGGSSSVAHLKGNGLDVIHVTEWSQVDAIFKKIKSGQHPYKTIMWDHLSEITNLYKMRVAPSGQPEIQQWGRILAEMMSFVRENRNMTITQQINVLFNAWEETVEDKTKVNLFRGFAAAYPGMITMLGRLTVYTTRPPYIRKLSFVPSDTTDSKFRVGKNEAAAKMPLELYMGEEQNFLADFYRTVKDGVPFPGDKYKKPGAQP